MCEVNFLIINNKLIGSCRYCLQNEVSDFCFKKRFRLAEDEERKRIEDEEGMNQPFPKRDRKACMDCLRVSGIESPVMKLSVFELIRRLLFLDLEEMRDKLAKLEKTLESTTQEKVRF